MTAIGGYFELELNKGEHYHKNALCLNTARNCLEYILKVRKYKKVYIPYYTCEVVLEPFKKSGVAYEFYFINDSLEPIEKILLKDNEAFLYTNYYGLKQQTVERLADFYGNKLIVDNSQAFFAPALNNIDTFYSARKFFGVPDGAYLYINERLDEELEQDISYNRMSHLLKRADISAEIGYQDFIENDNSLRNQDIKIMSNLTQKLLCSINYESIAKERRDIYKKIASYLDSKNLLQLSLHNDDIPMVYPFLVSNGKELKQNLVTKRVYVPTYWGNVLDWCDSEWEVNLTNNLLALPLDRNLLDKFDIKV